MSKLQRWLSPHAAKEQQKIQLRWTKLSSKFPGIRRDYGDGVLVGHLVYYFGLPPGRCFGLVYSLNTDQWEDLGIPHTRRYSHVCLLVEDKIYIYGGKVTPGQYLDELLVFDTLLRKAHRVETSSDGPGKRSAMTGVWVPGRREIVFFGGIMPGGGERRCNDTYAFNVDRSAWRELKMKGELPEKRSGHSAQLVGMNMYIFGGYTTGMAYLADMWLADLRQHLSPSWSKPLTTGATPAGRTSASLVYSAGVLFLYGGYSSSANVRHDLNLFHIDSGKWENSNQTNIQVTGESPVDTRFHLALATCSAIVYFTSGGVYELSGGA